MQVDFNKHLPEPSAQHSRPADRLQSPSCLRHYCHWPGLTSKGQVIQASASSPRQPHSTSGTTEATQKVKDLIRGHTATEQGNMCVHVPMRAYNPHVHMSPVFAKSLQSCPTPCDRMDCSPPASSVHGFSRQEYWSGLPFPSLGDLPDQGSNPGLPHCGQMLYRLPWWLRW